MAKKTPDVVGSIAANELYTLDALEARLGLGAWATRQMRRRGLRVLRCGGRGYVLGSDVIEHLASASRDGTQGNSTKEDRNDSTR